jgi:hypothetical protein
MRISALPTSQGSGIYRANNNRIGHMSARETSPQATPRTALLTAAVIVLFGILHIVAGVLLHDALAAPPIDALSPATYGD